MNQENNSPSMGTVMLTFLAGAAVGAVVVALTTPKTGPQLRGDLKDLAYRAKRRVGDMTDEACGTWNEMKERTALAVGDLKRGVSDAANDMRGEKSSV